MDRCHLTFRLHQEKLQSTIPVRTLGYTGQRFFTKRFSFGMLNGDGRSKNLASVPTVELAFELVSRGDGKFVSRSSHPHFMEVEIAAATEGSAALHPLSSLASPV